MMLSAKINEVNYSKCMTLDLCRLWRKIYSYIHFDESKLYIVIFMNV